MAMTGMDIQQVRMLAQQLQQSAGEIKTLMQRLTSQLQSTPWVGADRTKFEGDWTGPHCAALNRVAGDLEQAAQTALRNASEQEAASSS
jgi:hypothetical protein